MSKPQVNSYERKKSLDSSNVDISNAVQGVQVDVAKGHALPDEERGIEIDTEVVVDPRKMDAEKFMWDMLLVHLHDAGSEDDPQFVEITVNGVYRCIKRGEQAEIPRAHVAVLANAKQMRLAQTKITNADGSMGYQEKAVLRLTYPFSVMHDPNPAGVPWLRKLLQNPA